MYHNIDKILDNNKPILFGPFLGELGWEIMKFSGTVRWCKNKYPHLKIIIATRKDRYDLYSDLIPEEDAILFTIPDDYTEKFRPGYYSCESKEHVKDIMFRLKPRIDKYKNTHYMINTNKLHHKISYFSNSKVYYDYSAREENCDIIESIMKSHIGKIPILLFPRDRNEKINQGEDPLNNYRNWGSDNWNKFYDLIENHKDFVVFVSGKTPTYVKPKNRSFIDLEEIEQNRNNKNITTLGLTIEALKQSKLCISSQSAITILSNLLLTPSLMFGNEYDRLSKQENPLGNRFVCVGDNYFIKPEKLYNTAIHELEYLYEYKKSNKNLISNISGAKNEKILHRH